MIRGSGALAGVHVPLKFVTQFRGPPGSIPEGSSCRVSLQGHLVAIRYAGTREPDQAICRYADAPDYARREH